MTSNRQSLPFDYVLEDLQFRELLGQGGFGMTYLAYDWQQEEYVAVKEYFPIELSSRSAEDGIRIMPNSGAEFEDFEWGLRKFMDEAMYLAAFEHEAIVDVRRYFEANGTAYIVMSYIEGSTLSDLLEHNAPKRFSEGFVRSIIAPLIDGLEEVHRAGLLHRDIKPSNIIIRSERNAPVLIDFGAARQAVVRRSRDAKAVASPFFSPPEQHAERAELGPWTDIYALAAVAYQCLTGERPKDATDRVNGERMTSLSQQLRSQASPSFLLALDRAMDLDPLKRPRSIVEWRGELFEGRARPKDAAAPETPASPPAEKVEPAKPVVKDKKGQTPAKATKLSVTPMTLVLLVLAAVTLSLAITLSLSSF